MQNDISRDIFKLCNLLEDYYEKFLKKYKLKVFDVFILLLIEENEKINQEFIAHETYRSKTLIAQNVNKLVNRGFIEKRVDLEDKRNNLLFLTEKGSEVCQKANKVTNDTNHSLFDGISSFDIQIVKISFRIMIGNLNKINKKLNS
ncbi:MAG: MarR family winged helix-turn-helix transcriptional regulator [Bacilli bacterium]|jgi:DNA-binding MarR family transcriptional regulator|nr:MarR family winged helix-turn-helix transcriptional regulator [Bacilli bacterium]